MSVEEERNLRFSLCVMTIVAVLESLALIATALTARGLI